MASFTKTTDFLAKDSLPLNNAAKYVKGSEIDTEFNNIATADADNLKISALGTSVETALGVAIGSSGAPVLFNGALGTPSSGTATNITGLPIASGVSGLGANIATALAVAVGSAGAPVVLNGALGTPTSGTLTNATGLPAAGVVGTAAILGANTFTAIQRWAKGADVASANALTLGTDGNYFDITGTTAITSIGTLGVGTVVRLHFDSNPTLTHHATDLILPSGGNIVTAAGDEAEFIEYATGDWRCVSYTRAAGGAVADPQIQPISASVGSNALTISASTLSLDFRSATIGSGAVSKVSGTPANLVISSGSTLGTVSAQQSRLAVLAINNAGTIELAAVNIAGGTDLSETGVISTTAEGGAGAADSATVIYSTAARTNVAYRVIGYVESTQATAGTWATAPSTIQGQGGQALTAMSSIGYGQTWQVVTGSRASGTTYYNTTGRPILLSINFNQTTGGTLTVNGVTATSIAANAIIPTFTTVIPPSASYAFTAGSGISSWSELR